MEKIEEIALKLKTVYPPAEIKQYIIPLIQKILKKHQKNKTLIVGIQGGQGTGKTTLSNFMKEILLKSGYKVQAFSIDDFYETAAIRRKLAQKYPGNTFYQISRGMPGTHRVEELSKTLTNIRDGKPFSIPIFDKSLHDAYGDVAKTKRVNEKPDIILFEGWCVGIPNVTSKELMKICTKNKINLQNIDPHLEYHKVVLDYTKKYQPLWKFIDYFIMLKPTSAEIHKKWRLQQERELQLKTGTGMNWQAVSHFVDEFLPFTYVCYEKIKADTTILLNEKHRIYGVK